MVVGCKYVIIFHFYDLTRLNKRLLHLPFSVLVHKICRFYQTHANTSCWFCNIISWYCMLVIYIWCVDSLNGGSQKRMVYAVFASIELHDTKHKIIKMLRHIGWFHVRKFLQWLGNEKWVYQSLNDCHVETNPSWWLKFVAVFVMCFGTCCPSHTHTCMCLVLVGQVNKVILIHLYPSLPFWNLHHLTLLRISFPFIHLFFSPFSSFLSA